MGNSKFFSLLAFTLVLSLLQLPIHAQSLTVSPGEINPGASALVTYTNPNFNGASCIESPPNLLLEISASGLPCNANVIQLLNNNPGYNNVGYCDVNSIAQPTQPGVNYPAQPCLLPAPISKTIPCTETYYTNHTITPGVYNICTYENDQGTWYPSLNATLNVTTSAIPKYSLVSATVNSVFMPGINFGLQLTTSGSVVSIVPGGSAYSNYFNNAYPSMTPPADPCSYFKCYFELSGTNSVDLSQSSESGGCISPLELTPSPSILLPSLLACPTGVSDPSPDTPCLLTPKSGTDNQFDFSQYNKFSPGNYLLCGYAYTNGMTQNSYSPTTDYTPYENNVPLISPFFASANFVCGTSSCSALKSATVPSNTGVPTPIISFGSITFNAWPVTYPNSVTANFTSYGALQLQSGSYSPLYVYVNSIDTGQLSISSAQSVCAPLVGLGTKTPCDGKTGTLGTVKGCYYQYKLVGGATPSCSSTQPGASCNDGISGYPLQLSMEVNALSVTDNKLAAGNYLYCGVYQQQPGPPVYVAAGILTIINPIAPTPLPGPASLKTAPINTALCFIYGQLNTVLIILALLLMTLGAVIYAGSRILPPSQAGIAQGYAMGMLIAGIVGAIMASSALTVISIATNTPVSQIVLACKVIPGQITTSTSSTSTSTTTSSTSTTSTTTSTTSSTSTICPAGGSDGIIFSASGSPYWMQGDAVSPSGCDIWIQSGVIVNTNGWSFISGGNFIDDGTINTGSASDQWQYNQNLPSTGVGGYGSYGDIVGCNFYGCSTQNTWPVEGWSTLSGGAGGGGSGGEAGNTCLCSQQADSGSNGGSTTQGGSPGGAGIGGSGCTNDLGGCPNGAPGPGSGGTSNWGWTAAEICNYYGGSCVGPGPSNALGTFSLEGGGGGGAGSAAINGANCQGAWGGNGGFGVYIQANKIEISGSINSNGQNGYDYTSGCQGGNPPQVICGAGGGGGGGTVILAYNSLIYSSSQGVVVSGSINSAGGNGGNDNGCSGAPGQQGGAGGSGEAQGGVSGAYVFAFGANPPVVP